MKRTGITSRKQPSPPNHALRRERFRQQMVRATLAKQTGLSDKRLWEIEKRGERVRMSTATAIAQALDVDIDQIFRDDQVIG